MKVEGTWSCFLCGPLQCVQTSSSVVDGGGGEEQAALFELMPRAVCRGLSSLMSLLLVPRSPDSTDGNRKVPPDTDHTRGEQWLPWIQTPGCAQ